MAGEIEIRAAREDEVPDLLRLYEWLFAPPGGSPTCWDDARAAVAMRQAIESHDSVVLVAEAERRAASASAPATRTCTRCASATAAWVEDLAVAPARRSEGIGKALLDAAKAWAQERGATHLELDTGEARPDAHRFYEREGPSWSSRCFALRSVSD